MTEEKMYEMMLTAQQDRRRDWIAPVFAAIMAAVFSAVGTSWVTVSSLQVDIARIEERVEGFRSTVVKATQNPYTSHDAKRDNTIAEADRLRMQGLIDTIWPRLREMKDRIQHLEGERPPTDSRARSTWKY